MNVSVRDIQHFGKSVRGYPRTTELPIREPVVDEYRRPTSGDKFKDFKDAKELGKILVRPHEVRQAKTIFYGFNGVMERTTQRPSDDRIRELDQTRFIDAGLFIPEKILEFPKGEHTYDFNELVTLAVADANERQLDILTSLGELPETIGLMTDLLKKVRKPIQSLRELATWLKSGDPRKTVNASAEFWLTYRYGIMPIVYQVQDILKLYNDKADAFDRVTKRSIGVKPTTEPHLIPFNGRVHLKVMDHFVLDDHNIVVLKRCYNLGQLIEKKFALNPVQTGWELTTLSFVVDWFIQVGDAIAALSPTDYQQQAFTLGHRYKLSRRLVASLTIVGPSVEVTPTLITRWNVASRPQEICYQKVNSYTRLVGESLAPHFTIPVGARLNWKRVLDGFSLLWLNLRSDLTKKRK